MNRLGILLIVMGLIAATVGCGQLAVSPITLQLATLEFPTVVTQPATNVTTGSATLNMNYSVENVSQVDVRFAYRKSGDAEWSYTDWVSKSANGTYAESLSSLDARTLYDFKAQLRYDTTMIEGDILHIDTSLGQVASGRVPYCFIATAAYGTPMAPELQILRTFRDQYLLTNPLGQSFVHLYYRCSPPIANFITEHPSLKPVVRVALMPAVAMSGVIVNTTEVEKIAILGLLVLVSVAVTIWATRRRGSVRRSG